MKTVVFLVLVALTIIYLVWAAVMDLKERMIYDYQSKNGFIKRLGFRNNGQDIFCKEEKEMI